MSDRNTIPSTIRFYHVAALAAALNRRICVFDLETTTFRGNDNFGITEVAGMVFFPQYAEALAFGDLINPNRPISPKVLGITGITQEMVDGKEFWGKRYAGLFKAMSKEIYMSGFNIKSSDLHAVREMNARYDQAIEAVEGEHFPFVLDIQLLHHALVGSKTKKGTLEEIATAYGVPIPREMHRAMADVVVSVGLLNEIIDVHGLDAVLTYLLPKPVGARDKLTAENVARFAKGKTALTLDAVAKAFAVDKSKVGMPIGDAIDEGRVDPAIFGDVSTQEWLQSALVAEVDFDVLNQGKLKPIFQALAERKPEGLEFDYVQLRVAMSAMHLDWGTLKKQ